MKYVLTMVFLSMITGCALKSDLDTLSSPASMVSNEESALGQEVMSIPPLWGRLPVSRLASVLRSAKVIDNSLVGLGYVYLTGPKDMMELNNQLAGQGMVIRDGRLLQRQAHHFIEEPDPLGRPTNGVAFIPRSVYTLDIEFYRIGASASLVRDGIPDVSAAIGGQAIRFQYKTVTGLPVILRTEQERTYFERVNLPENNAGVIESRRGTVSAGLSFTGMLGVEGDRTRVAGALEISSFVGEGLDRATINLPIEYDSVLNEWVVVGVIDTADASASMAISSFDWDISAGAERVVARCRVMSHDGYVDQDLGGDVDGRDG